MLTRLKVSGFKNLVDADLYFGPFTCIAGGNAVGKSNLFDAIMFLSALAERPLMEAAMAVRDEGGRTTDIRTLFHASVNGHADRMRLEAEMLVPSEGKDDLGQPATASITFLRYSIELVYRSSGPDSFRSGLEIVAEELDYVSIGEAKKHLLFEYTPRWLKSVVRGRRTSHFISTDGPEKDRTIRLHQEGTGGRTRSFKASTLPRTVLSTVNAAESPTALLARREMQSWRILQLEPTSLRSPDPFTAPPFVGSDGSHLPATLYHLAHGHAAKAGAGEPNGTSIHARIGNRLALLVDDVKTIEVRRDDSRELFTLYVVGKDGTPHPARSLSDGTLRFLALSVLEADPRAQGVLCLEEPENGIHPERIISMLNLLQDLAVDTEEPVDPSNPLRQVIINTHSPTVVAQVPEDSLLLAERTEVVVGGRRSNVAVFRHLSGTWRDGTASTRAVQKGKVVTFLNPIRSAAEDPLSQAQLGYRQRQVIQREDIGQYVLRFDDR